MPIRDLPSVAPTTGIRLLIADDDGGVRSLFATLLREAAGVASVIEAGDGIEAVGFGREQRPELAVLDLKMPRLDGIAAALALRALQPAMQIALHSSDPDALRERASGLGLPLFDKLECEQLLDWVEQQAAESARGRETITGGASLAQKMELICSLCGYGIVSCKKPDRCPMCGGSAWADPPVGMPRASAY